MFDTIEKIIFVFIAALIGLLTKIMLDNRKKKIEKKEMANLFIARISSILDDRDSIESLLRDGGNNVSFEQNFIASHFERDDIYKALLNKLGSFPSGITRKIVKFFDYLNSYKRDLKEFKGKEDIKRWIGSYKLMIMGRECQMLLCKEVLQDNEQFNKMKENLKEEYCKRFIPAFQEAKKKSLAGSKVIKELIDEIELIFKRFEISDELNCV